MTTQSTDKNTEAGAAIQLETGTYEIIRKRLGNHTDQLRHRLDQLNDARKEVFGAIETQLIANDRVNTSNHCIARDIVSVGKRTIFGYNVHIGLRSGIQLKDVFSIYEFQGQRFQEADLAFLEDEKFQTDFQNLYRYYKDAFFGKFIRIGSYLYMVFQISKKAEDYKAFKWLLKEEKGEWILVYIDNRSDHEVRLPEQHEFKWKRVHRDNQRQGLHPHISILDKIFVETVGGDLTIKIEDNTDDGLGIYREEVEYQDQTLDDAEYLYADLGNLIALKIRPYQEDFRYFVYNEKMQQVQRVDSLEDSGVLLPDNHGLIFSNGYYLQTGEYKVFDNNIRNKKFEQRIVSPNGEDFLFVFYNNKKGSYVLLPYNLIAQKAETPIRCNGFTLFPDGELCYFRAEENPTKHHVVQIWQTPFITGNEAPSDHVDSYLYKVGNKDIVKAMAECNEILILVNKDDSYANLYDDLSKKCTDILDSYYWIDKSAAFALDEPLREIKSTASAAIEEYEKKISIQRNTQQEILRVRTKAEDLFQKVKRQSYYSVDVFVHALADLRVLRGAIISLKDLRYTNLELIDQLEDQTAEYVETLSENCVKFLLEEGALDPYKNRIKEENEKLPSIRSAIDAEELLSSIDQIGSELELLIDIVSNLKIEDTTQTTRIIDYISSMYAQLNQAKAAVRRHRKELMSTEAVAEFNAQLKLLDQGIINYLDVSDSPQKCDEYLTKLMVQLEELESKFVEFDEFMSMIADKREEVYNAFENRKKSLVEARNNRTTGLQKSAERILNGIQNRVKAFKEVQEINGFFAADLMIDKVRGIIAQLTELDDSNKANALQTQLKTLKEEAVRQLRDKLDLFVDGQNIIQFGKHKFSVNVQPLDLTVVQKDGKMFFHLTGTDFYEEITDPAFLDTQSVWQQHMISENKEVYRGEYLAYLIFQKIQEKGGLSSFDFEDWGASLEAIQKFAATRYEEGYVKGIHDEDAARIVQVLLELNEGIDLLEFSPDERAFAQLFWEKFLQDDQKSLLEHQLKSAGVILDVFPDTHEFDYLVEEVKNLLS